nr:hypothetical protein [Fusibacter ferrireducens]
MSAECNRFRISKNTENKLFKSIIKSGMRSALPHGVASDKIIEDGEFLTSD